MKVFVDSVPNMLKDDKGREDVKNYLIIKYNAKLSDILSRYKNIPPLMVNLGEHNKILNEARTLYVEGYFYSSIIMAGATAEKIAKQILVTSINLIKGEKKLLLSEKVVNLIENINMFTIREILIESGILHESLRKPFSELARIRNKYVHGGGKSPQKDAERAIKYLHQIIDGTVSLIKRYIIKQTKKIKYCMA